MTDDSGNTPQSHSPVVLAALAVALLSGIGGLIWNYTLSSKLSTQQSELTNANQKNTELAAQLRETNAKLQVTAGELSKSLGITQKQMDTRAQQIVAQEEAANRRLETAQKQTAEQVSAVQSDVSSVKTDVGGVKSDVGGVKSDVAKTQTELTGAIAQLQSIKGDLSSHSSLIARNHDELEILKHKGDRDYFEFTLNKGDRQRVGTVTLELKKADSKKSRFTLNIYADDKKYEKKDKNVNEPLQFYSGKDPALYEIVVNTISSKNQIAGYLSTPKNGGGVSSGR